MKGNIIDLNINKVTSLIYSFRGQNVGNPSYIVMSRDTANAIIGESMIDSSYCETLYGIPVAISNTLKFGVVDVV